jgi:hypothetical protein
LEERIESNWDRVGMGDGSMAVSSRVVRAVVCDFSRSHEEILHLRRRRHLNFWRWYREKKVETSTIELLMLCTMNDSTLIDRVSSPSVTIEERTELRCPVLKLLR